MIEKQALQSAVLAPELLTEAVVGKHTPDPLRYAFANKRSAHAGGMSAMIAEEERQDLARKALSTVPDSLIVVVFIFISHFAVCVALTVIFFSMHLANH